VAGPARSYREREAAQLVGLRGRRIERRKKRREEETAFGEGHSVPPRSRWSIAIAIAAVASYLLTGELITFVFSEEGEGDREVNEGAAEEEVEDAEEEVELEEPLDDDDAEEPPPEAEEE